MSDVEAAPAGVRCGAKSRKGTPCRNPPVLGKKRCRMHGGANGSGAPLGNRNAVKSGLYTKEWKERFRTSKNLCKRSKTLIKNIRAQTSARQNLRAIIAAHSQGPLASIVTLARTAEGRQELFSILGSAGGEPPDAK